MTRAEKCEAYAQHYLSWFRRDVAMKREMLALAEKRLEIAEAEYAKGEMVTGEADGIPAILRGMAHPSRR